jgi:hypothetical protein
LQKTNLRFAFFIFYLQKTNCLNGQKSINS